MSSPDLGQRLRETIRELSTAYFSMVMATGICSIGLSDDGFTLLSRLLLGLAAAGFVVLIGLNAWRAVSFRERLAADLAHPSTGFGFYTLVAGADVLAVRISADHHRIALGLLIAAALLWLVRAYLLPWTIRLGPGGHPIVAFANGTWFLWTVGVQSIAVGAAALAPYFPGHELPLIAVIAWGVGVCLYVGTAVFVAMRLLVHDITAADTTPPYWVTMGAVAITALAGSNVAHMPASPFADVARESIRSGSLLAWVLATWLMPAMFAVGWWRHVTQKIPLAYEPDLWSIVFPLGMYATACTAIGRSDALPWLDALGRAWIWVAIAAWAIVTLLGVRHVVRDVLMPARPLPG